MLRFDQADAIGAGTLARGTAGALLQPPRSQQPGLAERATNVAAQAVEAIENRLAPAFGADLHARLAFEHQQLVAPHQSRIEFVARHLWHPTAGADAHIGAPVTIWNDTVGLQPGQREPGPLLQPAATSVPGGSLVGEHEAAISVPLPDGGLLEQARQFVVAPEQLAFGDNFAPEGPCQTPVGPGLR